MLHKCENKSCNNMTSNRHYCCKACQYEGRKGYKLSDETKNKISKANKGRVHTEESRKHMSDAHKGNKLTEEQKQHLSDYWKGKVYSEETKKKISDSVKKSYERNNDIEIKTEYQKIASDLYEYKCNICGKDSGRLCVHHMDGNHENNDPNNLCWLCNSCHARIHGGQTHEINEEMTNYIKENRLYKIKGGN